jgi:hypothetical protein
VELPLTELVSMGAGLGWLAEVSVWLLPDAPTAALSLSVVSVAPISPVSFRAQPAKQINIAAINANFFIVSVLLVSAQPNRPAGPAWFCRVRFALHTLETSCKRRF